MNGDTWKALSAAMRTRPSAVRRRLGHEQVGVPLAERVVHLGDDAAERAVGSRHQ